MMKILIADKLSRVGIDWLESQGDVEVTLKPGLSPTELAEIVGEFDGMIVRSGAKVTAEVLANPGKLRGVARAGVGVDNIDIPEATKKGVIVMNTPGGNTVSTAELALTLMMALSRKVSPANASLKSGQWNRKAYQGTQVAGKTVGVIGMGRIGRAMAKRCAGLEMRVLGYDPFFAGDSPGDWVEMVKDLGELCKRADYISVHVPGSAETRGMIGAEQLALMKPTVRLVNAARGGIIDPEALLAALNEGKVAGAALDVYLAEPPETEAEQGLIQHPNVLAVPHLGASTEEAQDQVAIDAAEQLVEALRGGEVRNAINAPGFDKALPEALRPYTELASRIGTILAGITPGGIRKVEVIYRGAIGDMNVAPVTTYLLKGLLTPYLAEPVNVINAPVIAQQRGIEIEQITSAKVRNFANTMKVTLHTDQAKRSVTGTIFGNRYPRVISMDGYHMEMKPEGDIVIILNEDKPGVVGQYGSIFGANDINIADMTFSRKLWSGMAMVGINLDQPPCEKVVQEVRDLQFVRSAHSLSLPELPPEDRAEE